jgi:hypothetical protein
LVKISLVFASGDFPVRKNITPAGTVNAGADIY